MEAFNPQGLFVTGTDTGVGKTQVASALARLLADRGLCVRPRKPVESGCRRQDGHLFPADAAQLANAARSGEALAEICPYPFEPPLSPERAAALADIRLGLTDLRNACLHGVDGSDFLLVEGTGGFYSPLTADALNADLAQALGLPLLLVAADRLGAINHALLTVEAAKHRTLKLAGVVLNRIEGGRDPRMDNAGDLQARLGLPVVVTDRFDAAADAPAWATPCPALAGLADALARDLSLHPSA